MFWACKINKNLQLYHRLSDVAKECIVYILNMNANNQIFYNFIFYAKKP